MVSKMTMEEMRTICPQPLDVLSDSESVRWLNHTMERIWPVCMEEIVSQKILLPIIPWFLQKYKPWTAKEAVIQTIYLGRSPPMFTEMRVCRQSTGDDHLVLELGMNFQTADDMNGVLAVKLTKRLGFGMWAKMHLTVGVKFLPRWPFLGRLRVCFVEPPYFQMTVKPIFAYGLDVTELPGIAGWLDNLLTLAFEETLVEINDLRDGQRHELWLPLHSMKTGRLHIAIRVTQVDGKLTKSSAPETAKKGASSGELFEKSTPVEDDFEPVDVKGQQQTSIWVHHPGTEIPQVWEPRKGKKRVQKDSESVGSSTKSGSYLDDASCSDSSLEGKKTNSKNRVKRGLSKIGSVLNRTLKAQSGKSRSLKKMDTNNNWDLQSPSPHENVKAVNANEATVNLVMEEPKMEVRQSPEGSYSNSPDKRKVKDVAKSILKHAGNSARSMKYVFTPKGSKIRCDTDLAVESDSSFEDSIPPPFYEPEEMSPSVSDTKSEDVSGLMDSVGTADEVYEDSL
ncbi:hypothetical protein Ccrd_019585 [Cynara cardunculus var. scolymus]|uniref:SMP-LTD domain-containing protein n=1 Tax=Cynara cardunculus var. scolymus TaxID=59895 RepID=A0A124SF47_CYNCS|nr:hypothetical protein Ccrd_019585 [Cynara cardunculus var. scolymus]